MSPYFSSILISYIWNVYSSISVHILIIYKITIFYVNFYLTLLNTILRLSEAYA